MSDLFKKLEIIGFFFVSIVGTLLHFAYEASGSNFIAGIFAPVNESTFEHLKLLFYPFIIYGIIEYILLKKHDFESINYFICSKVYALMYGLLSIIVFFYTYSGVIGNFYDVVNIIIFYLSVLIASVIGYRLTQKEDSCNFCKNPTFCISLLILLISLFIVFTIVPPDIALFEAP